MQRGEIVSYILTVLEIFDRLKNWLDISEMYQMLNTITHHIKIITRVFADNCVYDFLKQSNLKPNTQPSRLSIRLATCR